VIRVYDDARQHGRDARAQGRNGFRFQDIDLNDTLEFTKQLSTLYAQWLKE
jgi:hypothetical protein